MYINCSHPYLSRGKTATRVWSAVRAHRWCFGNNMRYVGLNWVVILIGRLYLSGVCSGVDVRTHPKKMHLKEIRICAQNFANCCSIIGKIGWSIWSFSKKETLGLILTMSIMWAHKLWGKWLRSQFGCANQCVLDEIYTHNSWGHQTCDVIVKLAEMSLWRIWGTCYLWKWQGTDSSYTRSWYK